MFGFAGGPIYVDEVEIEADNSGWVTEFQEEFTVSSGAVEVELKHDKAGNLTYDGRYHYRYGPWNRLVDVKRAYNGGSGTGSRIAELRYDGLGRRGRSWPARRVRQGPLWKASDEPQAVGHSVRYSAQTTSRSLASSAAVWSGWGRMSRSAALAQAHAAAACPMAGSAEVSLTPSAVDCLH